MLTSTSNRPTMSATIRRLEISDFMEGKMGCPKTVSKYQRDNSNRGYHISFLSSKQSKAGPQVGIQGLFTGSVTPKPQLDAKPDVNVHDGTQEHL